jgi:AcrR family transcriptional regulator
MARPARFKEAIYRSALRLFGERGLSGTGIREIAKEAGVSEAALYRHWKGKKELAQAIFVEGMAGLYQQLTREVPTDGPACRAILATVEIFFRAYDAHPEVVHYLLLSQHELWRMIDRDQPNPVGFWFDLLRSRAGEFDITEQLSNDILGPITLGMILRPGIAAAYQSIATPLIQHAEAVAISICRVLGVPWVVS